MRKYINDAKARGAIPIVCSPIPRNDWKDGKVIRSTDSYAKWAEEVAKSEGAYFIDLNNLVATQYETMGAEKVKPFFPVDHTHTDLEGAKLNASIVVNELKRIEPGKLKKYLKKIVDTIYAPFVTFSDADIFSILLKYSITFSSVSFCT